MKFGPVRAQFRKEGASRKKERKKEIRINKRSEGDLFEIEQKNRFCNFQTFFSNKK